MKSIKDISLRFRRFSIQVMNWEYWPTWVVYIPVLITYPYWSLRTGSIFFFSCINPKMIMGGLYGTSKYDGLSYLDDKDKPTTLLFTKTESLLSIQERMIAQGLQFPVIIKPDHGDRGKGIEKVNNGKQLSRAIDSQTSDFLIQEYLDQPFEAGVFYIKKPGDAKGRVTSVVLKGFLQVTGDGHSTLEKLVLQIPRAVIIWKKLVHTLPLPKSTVLEAGRVLMLEPIGNHSRGTAFLDGRDMITTELEAAILKMAESIPEFHYGRFDVRAASAEAFMKGETIKVMEVNGACAEPAHIYESGASLITAWTTVHSYWRTAFSIAQSNQVRYSPAKYEEALLAYRTWQNIKKEKWNREPEMIPMETTLQ